jgi:predicted ATP-grasp superfamily ATP-dependent carboligase
MKSIFNTHDNQELITRINKLTPEAQAVWGKMSVDQMLSHCQAPIDVAFGNLPLKANVIMQLLGKMLKNKIINSPEFKKNSPTAPSFIRTEHYDFETTKKELIEKVSKFATEGQAAIKNQTHPFFGRMTYNEWDKLQYMHLDHHLHQFKV